MPAGYDAEVAELFRDLRSASGLTEADLAAQLATRTEVVQALEQGALYALPPWPETYRVVATYGTLLNLDVRPLCGASMPRSTQASSGSRRNRCLTCPSWRRPKTSSDEYQNQAPQAGPPAGEAFPSSPQQPAPPPQRAPQSCAGPASAASPSAISAVSTNAASVSASSAAVTAAAAAPAAAMAAAAKRRAARRHRERRLSRRRCRAPANPHWRPREGPGRPATASSQARARAARRSPARGQAAEEALGRGKRL